VGKTVCRRTSPLYRGPARFPGITPPPACHRTRSCSGCASLPGRLNALAEAFNSLFKAELIRNKGPWRGIDDVEIAIAEYIDWFNHRRLHGELGLVPPAEYELAHHDRTTAPTPVGA
jgi:transposase InsO family protein